MYGFCSKAIFIRITSLIIIFLVVFVVSFFRKTSPIYMLFFLPVQQKFLLKTILHNIMPCTF